MNLYLLYIYISNLTILQPPRNNEEEIAGYNILEEGHLDDQDLLIINDSEDDDDTDIDRDEDEGDDNQNFSVRVREGVEETLLIARALEAIDAEHHTGWSSVRNSLEAILNIISERPNSVCFNIY